MLKAYNNILQKKNSEKGEASLLKKSGKKREKPTVY